MGWRKKELDNSKVEEVLAAIRGLGPTTKKGEAIKEREIGYFEKNKERVRYDRFREQGYFIVSSVLEAGCRSAIGQRPKQSGMHLCPVGTGLSKEPTASSHCAPAS